ncbi:hypothetical protein D3C85_1493670 [compost metagenome]
MDLKIRQETKNRKSLDEVMRRLYKEFYQEKKRGFTDAEFRKVCEEIAGTPLPELFSYASTVKNIDYQKYLNYGGFKINLEVLADQNKRTDNFVKKNYEIELNEHAAAPEKEIGSGILR